MKSTPNNFLKYSSLGLQLLLVIGVCGWLGFRVDQWLDLKFPAFLLTMVLVSFGGMMYKLYRSLDE